MIIGLPLLNMLVEAYEFQGDEGAVIMMSGLSEEGKLVLAAEVMYVYGDFRTTVSVLELVRFMSMYTRN